MSRASADLVDAVQLAGRAITLEHEVTLDDLPRLAAAGARAGTQGHARLRFSLFEGRPAVDARIDGTLVMSCQRCMQPLRLEIVEATPLVIVPDEDALAPHGYEPHVAVAERMSLAMLIEEQLLLGMPLVPAHDESTACGKRAGQTRPIATGPTAVVAEDRQRPFSNLRDLLGSDEQ